jgi:hypothetical protein
LCDDVIVSTTHDRDTHQVQDLALDVGKAANVLPPHRGYSRSVCVVALHLRADTTGYLRHKSMHGDV